MDMRISLNSCQLEALSTVTTMLQSNGFDLELTALTPGAASTTTACSTPPSTTGKKKSARKAGKKTPSKSMTRITKSAGKSNQQEAANQYWKGVKAHVAETGCTVKKARQWYKSTQRQSS